MPIRCAPACPASPASRCRRTASAPARRRGAVKAGNRASRSTSAARKTTDTGPAPPHQDRARKTRLPEGEAGNELSLEREVGQPAGGTVGSVGASGFSGSVGVSTGGGIMVSGGRVSSVGGGVMVSSTGGGIGSGIVSSGVVCSTGGTGSGDITLSSRSEEAHTHKAPHHRGRRNGVLACLLGPG